MEKRISITRKVLQEGKYYEKESIITRKVLQEGKYDENKIQK